jgi:hypothetical protein
MCYPAPKPSGQAVLQPDINGPRFEGDSIMGDLLQPWHLIVLGFVGFLFVVPFWQIFRKAGYAPALSLLMLVPYLNFVVFLWLGFSDWPVLKKLRQLQGEVPPAP